MVFIPRAQPRAQSLFLFQSKISCYTVHVFEPETVLDSYKPRKIEWPSLSGFFHSFLRGFSKKAISNVGKIRKVPVKAREKCVDAAQGGIPFLLLSVVFLLFHPSSCKVISGRAAGVGCVPSSISFPGIPVHTCETGLQGDSGPKPKMMEVTDQLLSADSS